MPRSRLYLLLSFAVSLSALLGFSHLTTHYSTAAHTFAPPAATAAPIAARVYFSPGTDATTAAAEAISAAHQEVLIQAYSFTNTRIAKAAADARRRGVHVVAVLDRSQETEAYSCATYLARAGVETYIDSQHPIAHNKVAVIDGTTVVTGSMNFSRASESNAENLLILEAPELAAAYKRNFLLHQSHSIPYSAR